MDQLINLKIAAILVVFVAGMLGGQMAHLHRPEKPRSRLFYLSESLIAGIFFGVGLLHMLHSAITHISDFSPLIDYPLAVLLCALGFFVLLFLERAARSFSNYDRVFAMLLILMSLHALLAGIALGIESQLAVAGILFFAILIHKLSAGYILGIDLRQTTRKRASVHLSLVLFALMSPIGIAVGLMLFRTYRGTHGLLLEGVFDALVAGTFLYLAMHSAFIRYSKIKPRLIQNAIMLVLGFLFVAVATWWH